MLLRSCWAEPRGIASNDYHTCILPENASVDHEALLCQPPFGLYWLWLWLSASLTVHTHSSLTEWVCTSHCLYFTQRCSVDVWLKSSEWTESLEKRPSCSKCYIHSVTNSEKFYWVSVEIESLASFLAMSFHRTTMSELWSYMLVVSSTLRLENNESSLATPPFLQVMSYWDTIILTYLCIVYNYAHVKMTLNLLSGHIE